jgi:hypothetical protein
MEPHADQKPKSPTPKLVEGPAISGARAPKAKVVQVHFNIPEDQWRRFQAKLSDLGYSTASEFLRDKVREALREGSARE